MYCIVEHIQYDSGSVNSAYNLKFWGLLHDCMVFVVLLGRVFESGPPDSECGVNL